MQSALANRDGCGEKELDFKPITDVASHRPHPFARPRIFVGEFCNSSMTEERNMKQIRYVAVLTYLALLAPGWSSNTRAQEPSVTVTRFATGLVNPRGLKFGPDGNLYVAEAGFPTGDIRHAPVGLGGDCSVGRDVPGVEYIGGTTGS